MQDIGSWVSHLYQCAAQRCSEKCVKVPDQVIVHLLLGYIFLFSSFFFFFFLRPSDDCSLAWSIRARNTCIFFLLCFTEQWDLNLKNIFKTFFFFQSILKVIQSFELVIWLPAYGKFLVATHPCWSLQRRFGSLWLWPGWLVGTVAHLLDRPCPQAGFGRLNRALASSGAGLEPGLALLEGLETQQAKAVERNQHCRSLSWESRGGFCFA